MAMKEVNFPRVASWNLGQVQVAFIHNKKICNSCSISRVEYMYF